MNMPRCLLMSLVAVLVVAAAGPACAGEAAKKAEVVIKGGNYTFAAAPSTSPVYSYWVAIAKAVKKVVEEEFPEKGSIPIEVTSSNDLRSYHINSGKIKRVLGFEPKHSVEDAVRDLCEAFRQGKLPNSFEDDRYYNVRTMKAAGAK